MRILWHSNAPWVATGYGNQTRLFTNRINDAGYPLAISAFYGLDGGALGFGKVRVYPKLFHPYGQDAISHHSKDWKADIVITLVDSWVFEPAEWDASIRWVPWFPIDSEPVPGSIVHNVAQAHKRIVFSRFAEQQIHDTGLDCYYVPHGIDTDTYKPLENRMEGREVFGLPKDAFVIGMIAANKGRPSRKAIPEHLMAFKQFQRSKPDAVFYLHTWLSSQHAGLDIIPICDSLGLKPGKDIFFPNQYRYLVGGYSDPEMNLLYNAFDVHALASMGEGFGIPTVEAQAAGTPVIVGDWTACGELCFSGWKIDKGKAQPNYTANSPDVTWQYLVKPDALADTFRLAYRDAGKMRDQARAGALAYDVNTVMEKYWLPVLAEIEATL